MAYQKTCQLLLKNSRAYPKFIIKNSFAFLKATEKIYTLANYDQVEDGSSSLGKTVHWALAKCGDRSSRPDDLLHLKMY